MLGTLESLMAMVTKDEDLREFADYCGISYKTALLARAKQLLAGQDKLLAAAAYIMVANQEKSCDSQLGKPQC